MDKEDCKMNMEQSELISVIIPVYKVEKYLKRCLDSIQHQTYANLEIILVDDGSPDGCGQICDEYAVLDPRIKVVHQKNGGLSAARNIGLALAKANYIGFIDSDDWASVEMFQTLLHGLIEQDADMAICQFILAESDGRMISPKNADDSIQVLDNREAIRRLILDEITSHAWRKLYKRDILGENPFPVGKYFEDVFCMPDIFYRCSRIVCINRPLYYYYQRSDSIVKTLQPSVLKDFMESVKVYTQKAVAYFPDLQREAEISILINCITICKSTCMDNRKEIAQLKKNAGKIVRASPLENLRQIPIVLFIHGCVLKYGGRFVHSIFSRGVKYIKKQKKLKEAAKMFLNFIKNYKKEILPIQVEDGQKKIVLIGSVEGTNLGDVAISEATQRFICRWFPGVPYFEITEQQILYQFQKVKKVIGKQDVLLLQGGGNVGSLYWDQQKIRKKWLRHFHKNPTILMPQSVYFSDNEYGQNLKKEINASFSACKKITLFAREPVSYKRMQEVFSSPVQLVPDIVLSMNVPSREERTIVGVCLRDDIESNLSAVERRNIIYKVQEHYGVIKMVNTCIGKRVSTAERAAVLNDKFQEFSQLKMLITDRLHGVIFSVITHTPCIIIKNNNGKTEGIFHWLKGNPSIQLCESLDQLEALLTKIDHQQEFPKPDLDNQFLPLVQTIQTYLQ